MSIVALGSVDTFFQEIVDDSLRRRRVNASTSAASYLVGVLADQTHTEQRADSGRPLAFQLDDALKVAPPAERFQRLRALGDGVLYSSGFFADHFEARGVDATYLVGIGASAYGHAASMLRGPRDEEHAAPDVFRELAERFAEFVLVITDVAHSTLTMGVESSRNVLAVYERWLKTGSDRLAEALNAQ